MKTFKFSEYRKSCRAVRGLLVAPLLGASLLLNSSAQDGNAPPVVASPTVAQAPPARLPQTKSQTSLSEYTRISDILKLVDAGVNADVIKTYVKNSAKVYNLTATDIVTLKERGVADDIISGMLQRDSELRTQGVQARQAAQLQQAAPPQPASDALMPVPQYAPQPTYVVQAPPAYPVYDYGYYYGSAWPYYYPSVSIGVGYVGGHYGYHGGYVGHGGGYVGHSGGYAGHGGGGGGHGSHR